MQLVFVDDNHVASLSSFHRYDYSSSLKCLYDKPFAIT
jgi:hypothetical protein